VLQLDLGTGKRFGQVVSEFEKPKDQRLKQAEGSEVLKYQRLGFLVSIWVSRIFVQLSVHQGCYGM